MKRWMGVLHNYSSHTNTLRDGEQGGKGNNTVRSKTHKSNIEYFTALFGGNLFVSSISSFSDTS